MNTPMLILYASFFFALGACVGSFLNVVIWRLPHRGTPVEFLGKTAPLTLSWPPSHCPVCNTPIYWYQNIPILAWLVLRGRCAKCRTPIAIRYPLVELSTGLLFLALFLAYFVGHWNVLITDFSQDWPIFVLHLFFMASLLAASAIDADWYIIPPEIPWLVALIGLLAAPFIDRPALFTIDPRGPLAWPVVGSSVGLLVSLLMVRLKIIPRSFESLDAPPPTSTDSAKAQNGSNSDPPITPPPNVTRQWPSILVTLLLLGTVAALWVSDHIQSTTLALGIAAILIFLLGILPRDASAPDVTDEVVAEISTPHVRREMITELAFLSFPVMGALIASMFPAVFPAAAAAPWLGRLLGALLGFLVGGLIVWLARIGGSLWLGKEAMGLGDIHLMCGVGVILGAPLTILTFFVFGPVLGLLWSLVLISLRKPNVLPYGPWLSVGAILALFVGQPILHWYLSTLS